MEKNFLIEAEMKGKSSYLILEELVANSFGHIHALALRCQSSGKGKGKRFTWKCTLWVDLVGFPTIVKSTIVKPIKLRVCSELSQNERRTFEEIDKFLFSHYHTVGCLSESETDTIGGY